MVSIGLNQFLRKRSPPWPATNIPPSLANTTKCKPSKIRQRRISVGDLTAKVRDSLDSFLRNSMARTICVGGCSLSTSSPLWPLTCPRDCGSSYSDMARRRQLNAFQDQTSTGACSSECGPQQVGRRARRTITRRRPSRRVRSTERYIRPQDAPRSTRKPTENWFFVSRISRLPMGPMSM